MHDLVEHDTVYTKMEQSDLFIIKVKFRQLKFHIRRNGCLIPFLGITEAETGNGFVAASDDLVISVPLF